MATHPGVYCLRSSETDWDEDALWRTYTTLTDVEAVFRSLKAELGLRPIYHHKPRRADGHLFITVIAYQLVQVIRTRLRGHGQPRQLDHVAPHPGRPAARHRHLPAPRRTHAARANGHATRTQQRDIYDALGVDPHPGGVAKRSSDRPLSPVRAGL